MDESKAENELMKTSDNAVREEPDVNQAPMFESGITRMVPEDAGDGDKVGGPVTAADPDMDALTYTISGGADMGAFEITPANRSSGQITVKKGTELDFEGSQTTYMVEVKATDPFGLNASTMVTITVTDVNEKPEVTPPGDPCKQDAVTMYVTCDYDENGTDPVANFSAMDPEGEMIVWSLGGADASDFDITGGVLSFKSSPDFESPMGTPESGTDADNSYEVMVVATEVRQPGSLDLAQSNDIMVTVTVKNVEEDPSLTLNRLQVRAGSNATVMATLTDPDEVDTADHSRLPVVCAEGEQAGTGKRGPLEQGPRWRRCHCPPTLRTQQTPARFCAWLRRTPTGPERKAIKRTPGRLTP